jgi:RNA polymerase sigma-70 factor, ECF subfamily
VAIVDGRAWQHGSVAWKIVTFAVVSRRVRGGVLTTGSAGEADDGCWKSVQGFLVPPPLRGLMSEIGDALVLVDQVHACRIGDDAATEWLARYALGAALRTAGAILLSREQARDVAQDVAVDVLVSLPRLRDPAAFDAWVHRITVRHTLRALRRRRARELVEMPLHGFAAEREAVAAGGDLDLLLSARGALAIGLARLPARQQVALALRYVHDLSDVEIAAALGCRIGSVHSLLSRARSALRQDPALEGLSAVREGEPR